MTHARSFAFACISVFAATAALAGPFDQFKGKMKEGLYEYKMDMDMGSVPGMPPGMSKQNMTFQRCLTAEDIEKGQMGRGTGRSEKMPENCEVKNFKMSGNTATYTMACKGDPEMTTDNKVTFAGDSFTMDMDMAMMQGGQPMKMKQHMESRYLGPCKR